MISMKKTSLGILAVVLLSLGLTALAQQRTARTSDRQVGPILRRIETGIPAFHTSLKVALDQNRQPGARSEENINEFVSEFVEATARFRERFDNRQADAADAQEVIDRASLIDNFMRRRRLDARANREWGDLRLDLDQLARYYKVSWRPDER